MSDRKMNFPDFSRFSILYLGKMIRLFNLSCAERHLVSNLNTHPWYPHHIRWEWSSRISEFRKIKFLRKVLESNCFFFCFSQWILAVRKFLVLFSSWRDRNHLEQTSSAFSGTKPKKLENLFPVLKLFFWNLSFSIR